MNRGFRSILLMAAIALVAPAIAGATDFALDKTSCDQMCREARQAYDQSQNLLDKVNYLPALDAMVLASEKQPDMPELGFLVGCFASYEARKHIGEDAIGILHKAESAYERVLDIPNLRHADHLRAETALAKVKAAIAGEADRDARIEKTGQEVIQSAKDLVEKLRAAKAAELAAEAANGTLPPGNGMAPVTAAPGAGGAGGGQGLPGALNNATRGSGSSVGTANMSGGAVTGGGRSSGGSSANSGGGRRAGGGRG